MGKAKQTLPVGGVAMLQRVLTTLRRSGVGEVVVVLGAGAEAVRENVPFEGERVVLNPEYQNGLGSSLRTGIGSLDPSAEAAIVVLADQPLVSASTIDSLISAYEKTKAPVVAPFYHGVRGNPVLFDRSLFPELVKIEGDVGAKSVVRAHGREMFRVDVQDRGVVTDVDTPNDYALIEPGPSGRTQGEG